MKTTVSVFHQFYQSIKL